MSAHCAGSFANIGDQVDEHGACEFVNAAATSSLASTQKGDAAKAEGTWHVVHGTGKFEGMTMEGKFMSIGPFPPSGACNSCNHEWGPTPSNSLLSDCSAQSGGGQRGKPSTVAPPGLPKRRTPASSSPTRPRLNARRDHDGGRDPFRPGLCATGSQFRKDGSKAGNSRIALLEAKLGT